MGPRAADDAHQQTVRSEAASGRSLEVFERVLGNLFASEACARFCRFERQRRQ
jgi:hypothetical protein